MNLLESGRLGPNFLESHLVGTPGYRVIFLWLNKGFS